MTIDIHEDYKLCTEWCEEFVTQYGTQVNDGSALDTFEGTAFVLLHHYAELLTKEIQKEYENSTTNETIDHYLYVGSRDEYLRLQKDYEKAEAEGAEQFMFTDDSGTEHELLTKYAMYLLEYLSQYYEQ